MNKRDVFKVYESVCNVKTWDLLSQTRAHCLKTLLVLKQPTFCFCCLTSVKVNLDLSAVSLDKEEFGVIVGFFFTKMKN